MKRGQAMEEQQISPRSHSHPLTPTTRKWLPMWLVTWLLLLTCHLTHVTANVSFATGMVRLNKTRLDEINKRAWLNKLSKMLELADSDNAPPPGGMRPVNDEPPPTPGEGQGVEGQGGKVDDSSQGQPPPLLPAFVFSTSPGKNVLEFALNRTNPASVSSTMAKVNLYLYVRKRRESRRTRRNRRRSKSRRSKSRRFIKLRVFQVDERNRKVKRIAELRKRVHSSHWHRLGLPVSLVRSLWQAHNGTLRLRVKCKRCNKKIQLVMPPSPSNCSHHQKSRRRPGADPKPVAPTPHPPKKEAGVRRGSGVGKCPTQRVPGHVPFMVIENKADGWPLARKQGHSAGEGPVPSSLAKSSRVSSSPPMSLRNFTRHSRSVPGSSSVGMGRAGEGSPVPPVLENRKGGGPAWSRVVASARGGNKLSAELSSELSSESPLLPDKARYRRSVSESSSEMPGPIRICNPHPRHRACCVLAVPVDPAEFDTGVSIVAPSTLTLTTCEGQCRNHIRHNRRRMRARGPGRRRGGSGGKRRKSRQWSCAPVDTQALDIWYFDHHHNLAHASLPGMLVTQCGCRRN